MMASLPLFGGAALVLGSSGTLSLLELSGMAGNPMIGFAALLLLMGVVGETGVAPFYATKAEMFRTPGSPFILIIHLSSLLVIVRAIEVLLIVSL
jgi:energy-converting hydrogenase A subunit H